jgi:hypothetical protein
MGEQVPDSNWSDEENDIIVEAYFAMLSSELAGFRYVKAEQRRAMMAILPGRSEGSIEFKHQNISAVLLGLGEPWIDGYKPAERFQSSLVDAVLRWLARHPSWSLPRKHGDSSARNTVLREPGMLYVGPPPTLSNTPSAVQGQSLQLIARRIDVAARDERNRDLGRAGEELVFERERSLLAQYGRRDLSRQVVWSSRDEGDGLGYDISSFEPDGSPRLIEVKTTNGWERTPFHITRNELAAADHYRESWRLLRVWNYNREPKAFEIAPPLERHFELTPTTFLAALR